MDLSVQNLPTSSPIRYGKKAIMRKFMKEETQKSKMLSLINSKKSSLPDLTYCLTDPITSDDVIIIEDSRDMEDMIVQKQDETISSEEEVHHEIDKSVEVTILEESDDSTTKSKPRDYKCPSCKYTSTHKLMLKTHMLLHTIAKNEITSDNLVHTCEQKKLPCYLCNFPKINLKIDIKPVTSTKSLECPLCPRKFLKKNGLNKHLQAHIDQHKKRSAQLGKREKKTNKKNQLILQMASNGKQFPFECSKCKLPFAEEYDKRAHEELCRRRQYKHLWNFSNVNTNNSKCENTQKLKTVKTMDLKTVKDVKVDTEEAKIIIDVNMNCDENVEKSPWRPWA